MNNKIQPEEISIEILNESHNIADFRSYETELVKFLIEDALSNQKQNLSITFLCFYEGILVGFVTLLTDRINLEGELRLFFDNKGIHYKALPALKIGRICVDDSFLKRGLGKFMVLFAIQKAKEINEDKAGCRFLTLDAKINISPYLNPINFYKKLKFKVLGHNKDTKTIPMYLDLKDIIF